MRTDHSALPFMFRKEKLTGRMTRWACMLSEYKFTVVTRPGQGHANADGLSRCLPPNELTKALDVVDDDETKVFSLVAEG